MDWVLFLFWNRRIAIAKNTTKRIKRKEPTKIKTTETGETSESSSSATVWNFRLPKTGKKTPTFMSLYIDHGLTLRSFRFSRQLCRLLCDCVMLKLCACVTSSQTFTLLFENVETAVLTFTPKQWTPFSRVNDVLVHTNAEYLTGSWVQHEGVDAMT